MILINGQPESRIDIADRGLQYGDGLFETIAFRHARLEFLDAHLSRLKTGCQRLAIDFHDWQTLSGELTALCSKLTSDSVVKIMLTRGSGGRGYKAPLFLSPTRIISSHPMPDYPASNQSGVNVRLCQQRLGINPSLAGIKHLNRLEQVLARNEWHEPSISEGLMLDINDHIIEGTMSNVFIVSKGKLQTPSLINAGIAGIKRAVVMQLATELNIDVSETQLTLDDLLAADEVFLTNSIIGIWPVITLQTPDTQWCYGNVTQQLQQALQGKNR